MGALNGIAKPFRGFAFGLPAQSTFVTNWLQKCNKGSSKILRFCHLGCVLATIHDKFDKSK